MYEGRHEDMYEGRCEGRVCPVTGGVGKGGKEGKG